ATLFRALDLLTELRVVERLDLPSGEHAYVPCLPAHHHHVICSRCGRTTEVEDAGVAEAVAEIARRSGYRIDTHRLELFGLCRHCQAKTTADALRAPEPIDSLRERSASVDHLLRLSRNSKPI